MRQVPRQKPLRQELAAAHVKAGLCVSYADAFVIALAQQVGGVVVTGDPEFPLGGISGGDAHMTCQ